MKLWIWSDLHLEMQEIALPSAAPDGVDAIVCAGDLSYAPDVERHAFDIVHRYGVPVIFVPGNHEFYSNRGARPPRTKPSDHRLMKQAAEASRSWAQPFHVLDDDTAELGGVRFVGGTLWTDFRMYLVNEVGVRRRMQSALAQLADFSRIWLGDGEQLSPQVMLGFHLLTRGFIERQLAIPFDGKTVVVTHHLPHPHCTPAAYVGRESNYLFACSKEAFESILTSDAAPALWVCGHTHHYSDVKVGRTRIVCNPFGYLAVASERDNDFQWDLVIDTEDLT
ncbi:metallophosphoesterase [Mesorhizobium sp. NZP2077]|uniref:metallophosphoesterase n=1 Tax=Mesorhizobium sp. NZP2077 TaxID=2483404 RepID=UPI001557C93A|nr:metallophosphoesterase [Mesorhizobium sp. NZP2077]QKC83499.1 metallophosphoesterase [Mesorhizobium sp. NZP2077]QKD17014.1 metallophosphoesterase [Mesorhizobium sp. NZP2077]